MRDVTVAAECAFHNAMLEAKNQVKAQNGAYSNEVAAVGLTRASERQPPGRAAAPTAPK